ncbi:MAG: hypothetical protein PHE69_01355 [Patescibacteria group bacterium]|nr:hypothetical protein [Patescibacteria group bacterium]
MHNPLYLFGRLWFVGAAIITIISIPTFVQRMLVMTMVLLSCSAIVAIISDAVEAGKEKKQKESAQS